VARRTLGGDSLTNGLLQSARGVGAVCAALLIATFVGVGVRGKVLTAASLAFPIMILLFSLTRSLAWSMVGLVAVGAANIMVNNLSNSMVQTMSPEALRGGSSAFIRSSSSDSFRGGANGRDRRREDRRTPYGGSERGLDARLRRRHHLAVPS